MSKKWAYAELSKTAKNFGGPEKYVEVLKNANFNLGKCAGREEMVPWIIGATITTACTVYGFIKVRGKVQQKKQESKLVSQKAEKKIIEGIKEYENENEVPDTPTNEKTSENKPSPSYFLDSNNFEVGEKIGKTDDANHTGKKTPNTEMNQLELDKLIQEIKGTIERGDCLYCGAKDAMIYVGNVCFICTQCQKSVHENTFYSTRLGIPFVSEETILKE